METGKNESEPKKVIAVLSNHAFMLYRFRSALIRELLKDWRVAVLLPEGEYLDVFSEMGCQVYITPMNRRKVRLHEEIALMIRYERILKEVRPQKVLAFSMKPNLYGALVCRKLRIPFYAHIQGLGSAFEKRFWQPVLKTAYGRALKNCEAVFFENTENCSRFQQLGIVEDQKTCVLAGAGISLEEYGLQPYPTQKTVRFLYLGRIMKEKGIEEFLEAACRMKEAYGDRVSFEIAGFFEEEEAIYHPRILALEEKGIVTFSGFLPDPKPAYRRAHCVVVPSYHEGMCNVLLEAAASGRPCIATDISGCQEAVKDGVSGFLCEKKSASSLTDRMETFLLLPDEEKKAMGLAGRRLMEEHFDKKDVVRNTLHVLDARVRTGAG